MMPQLRLSILLAQVGYTSQPRSRKADYIVWSLSQKEGAEGKVTFARDRSQRVASSSDSARRVIS